LNEWEKEEISILKEQIRQMEESDRLLDEKINLLKQDISQKKKEEERKKIERINSQIQKQIIQIREKRKKERLKYQELMINDGLEAKQRSNLSHNHNKKHFVRLKRVSQKIESHKKKELITEKLNSQQNKAEVEERSEKDYSATLDGIALGGLQILSKLLKFHNSHESNSPINSTQFWDNLSEYLKKYY
jgi:hypothetical protein